MLHALLLTYWVDKKHMCLLSQTRHGDVLTVIPVCRLTHFPHRLATDLHFSNNESTRIQVLRSQWKAELMLLVLVFAGG